MYQIYKVITGSMAKSLLEYEDAEDSTADVLYKYSANKYETVYDATVDCIKYALRSDVCIDDLRIIENCEKSDVFMNAHELFGKEKENV